MPRKSDIFPRSHFIKTRLQKQQKDASGKLPYKGLLDCARKVAKEEGWLRFYRGFGTYYVRIAPHALVAPTFSPIFPTDFVTAW